VEIVPELMGALALLVTALWQGYKTRAEVAQIRHQLHPNGGASLRDRIDRIDRRQVEIAASIGGVRDDARADRQALTTLQADATAIHAGIAARLDQIERRLT